MAENIVQESETDDELELLEFVVGGNCYGIHVAKVEEIIGDCEIQKIPHAKPFVEGVFRRRGRIYSAISLAEYLGLEGKHTKDLFLIPSFDQGQAAFRVDEVKTIHHIFPKDIQEPDRILSGDRNSLVAGIAKLEGNRMLLILDFEKMLSEIHPDSEAEFPDAAEKSAHAGARILVAESDPSLRELLVERLERAGLPAIAAEDGGEAWDRLREDGEETPVACVLTDLSMPQVDGLSLLGKIREDPALNSLPVIVFAPAISEELSLRCEQAGASAQLSGPDAAGLVACVDRLLDT